MKICLAGENCLVLILENEICLEKEMVSALVNKTLSEKGIAQWSGMYIDIFTSGTQILLIARPNTITKVSIAPYALPYLMDYFTE